MKRLLLFLLVPVMMLTVGCENYKEYPERMYAELGKLAEFPALVNKSNLGGRTITFAVAEYIRIPDTQRDIRLWPKKD